MTVLGEGLEAVAAARHLVTPESVFSRSPFPAEAGHSSAGAIAAVYAFRGEAHRAFEWLEQAYAQRDPGLSQMKRDPLLKSLERDPRYAAFLKKMRLPA